MVDYGFLDEAGRRVTLREVDANNWRAVAEVAPRDDQRDCVMALAAYYLLLSSREGIWRSLAVYADESVVGHIMWCLDDFEKKDGAYWIGGVMIAAAEQGKGVGRAMLQTMIAYLGDRPDTGAIRLAYMPENLAAARFYKAASFLPTGEMEGDTLVVELLRVDSV